MSDKRSIAWVDAGGRTRQTILRSSAGAPNTQAQLKLLSNADILDWFEGADHVNAAPAPSTAPYSPVSLFAALNYADAGGNLATVTLPAPHAGIFLADGVTVDSAAIAALNAAIAGEVITAAGNPVVVFIGGILRGKRPSG